MSKNDSTARQSKLGQFWKGVKAEFKKIIWPDRDTLIKQLIAVLCVTFVTAVLIAIIDFGAQNAIDFLTTFKAS